MRLQRIILKGIITISVSLPLIFNSLAFAERWTVESLQKEIDARGLKWKAGKTTLSDLSLEELQTIFPPILPHTIRMMPAEERIVLPDDFPTFLDWRNYKGGNWISPIKDQTAEGTVICGSCSYFATLANMESLIKLHFNDPDLPIDLSEQYLLSCGSHGFSRGYYYGGCSGNYVDYLGNFLMINGVPDEECFPYENRQSAGTEVPCIYACSDVASRVHKLSSYSFIGGKGFSVPYGQDVVFLPYPENIKAVLINKPVYCGMILNPDDWQLYNGGIYEPISFKPVGHYVQIIGFDDAQQCWIGKNSQGTDWGETADFKPYTPGAGDGGYFRIAYVTSRLTKTFFGVYAIDAYYGESSPVSTSTTTTITCPSEELYGEGSEELELLRYFRDTVLNQTPEGRELIKLYYQWSPTIVKAMEEDEGFKEAIKELIDAILMKITEGESDENN